MTQQPNSDTTVFLDQPPSCLQFCPVAPNHVVIGTYLLSETSDDSRANIKQTKTGSLQLWKLDPVASTLIRIQRIFLPYAVFDLHFHPRDPTLLAVAGSAGCIDLFRVNVGSTGEGTITELCHIPAREDDSIPALFLAWTPQGWLGQGEADGFAVTFSNGQTSVFGTENGDLSDPAKITELGTFCARETIEVWFVALATYQNGEGNDRFLFTGDDFASLHTHRFGAEDIREDDDILPPVLLDHDDRGRHHTAGVTSILPLPLPLADDAPLLLTGSYDEYLRIYHATLRGAVLAELCLGGGVWRLQLLKKENTSSVWKFLVLASCMHGGARVVSITGNGGSQWDIKVLAEFTEHESMNYASDAWRGEHKGDRQGSKLLCLSSSFYDKRVCMWRVDV